MTVMNITAVMTCHSEGVLSGPSFLSFQQAIAHARSNGISVESLVLLDRPTPATLRQFANPPIGVQILQTDLGDPGLARNAGAKAAKGTFVSFLDGDDLWCKAWLTAAHGFCTSDNSPVVAHSECNVVFGEVRVIWWHADSRDSTFDVNYLRLGNYWDAMSFCRREILFDHPFVANDLAAGIGHEDWHWNCETFAAGIDHRPVPGTVHFKRRRKGSQMALCDAAGAMVRDNALSSYQWERSFSAPKESS